MRDFTSSPWTMETIHERGWYESCEGTVPSLPLHRFHGSSSTPSLVFSASVRSAVLLCHDEADTVFLRLLSIPSASPLPLSVDVNAASSVSLSLRCSPSLYFFVPLPPSPMQGGGAVHRGYLDQAIAFKREQANAREGRARGRRRSAAEEREVERENRQREAAFSVYFNGANNEDKPNASTKPRQSPTRKDHPTPPPHPLSLHFLPLTAHHSPPVPDDSDRTRRDVRRSSKEVTGKITESQQLRRSLSSPTSSPLPLWLERKEEDDRAFALSDFSSSAAPRPSFLISSPHRSSVSEGRRRRRTWACSAVEVKTEDGEVVQIQPRRINWDEEEDLPPPPAPPLEDGREEKNHRGERGEGKESVQDPGEDSSAESSQGAQDVGSSPPSHSSSPPSTSRPSSPSVAPITSMASDSEVTAVPPPLSKVAQLDLSTLDAVRPPSSPSAVSLPVFSLSSRRARTSLLPSSDESRRSSSFTSTSLQDVFPPAPKPTFARRASAPPMELTAEVDAAPRASTAWMISVKTSDGGAERESGSVDGEVPVSLVSRGRRRTASSSSAERPNPPAASASASRSQNRRRPSSTSPSPTQKTVKNTLVQHPVQRSEGRDVGPPPAEETKDTTTVSLPSASAPPLPPPGGRRSSSLSMEELERSFDSLAQLHLDLRTSTHSTAAQRRMRHTPLTHPPSHSPPSPLPSASPSVPPSLSPADFPIRPLPVPLTPVDEDSDADVDALIDEFLASSAPPTTTAVVVIPAEMTRLPLLPAGRVLTLRFHSRHQPAASHVTLTQMQLFDERGRFISIAPTAVTASHQGTTRLAALFSSTNSTPLSLPFSSFTSAPSLTVAFESEKTLSAIAIWNGASDCEDAQSSRSGVRLLELRLDDRLIFCGHIRRSSAQAEYLYFTREDSVIACVFRSMQPHTTQNRPSSARPLTSSSRKEAAAPSGRLLQLLLTTSSPLSPAQLVVLPAFRVMSSISNSPLLVNPSTEVSFLSSAQPTGVWTALVTVTLPTTLPVKSIDWDDGAQLQGLNADRLGVQVMLDGRLVWLGSMGGDGNEVSHSGLGMRWGSTALHEQPQRLRVRVWRDGREVPSIANGSKEGIQ